ncbi:hypothetical protein B0T21DRAFT_360803 [Apiosordaria backusii]|uniref:Uncharacterized protein n=1 Tax=Apiosordaria backusii TaxID=314023 RepID=A0AA40K172_9PEZI|nr:hypothetical protein B0T21DRAFT_360803 [Apiosordaria backusii]
MSDLIHDGVTEAKLLSPVRLDSDGMAGSIPPSTIAVQAHHHMHYSTPLRQKTASTSTQAPGTDIPYHYS